MSNDAHTHEHFDEIELQAFSSNPDELALEPRRHHLLACEECRSKIANLQMAEQFVKNHSDVISLHSRKSPVKAQLHEITHALATTGETEATVRETSEKKYQIQFVDWIRSALTIKAPAFAIPATALATFVFAFLILGTGSTEQHDVVNFQDSQSLVLTRDASQPGLGFFHGANEDDRILSEYAGFEVKHMEAEHAIQVSWPAITDAVRYDLVLFEISNNVKQQVSEISTEQNVWTIRKSYLRPGQLYRLTLTGKTHDNYTFRHSGGFILRN